MENAIILAETHGVTSFGNSANYSVICYCIEVGADEVMKTKTDEELKKAGGTASMVL